MYKIRPGTILFSLTFNGICQRIQLMHANKPDWKYKVKRTDFGLWQVTIV